MTDTFTREELEEAAHCTGLAHAHLGSVRMLMEIAVARREPEYEDYGVYEDDMGEVWMFCSADPGTPAHWLQFGSEEITLLSDVPRPLWPMTSRKGDPISLLEDDHGVA
jgi:hypothetical protein